MNALAPQTETPTRPVLRYHGGKWLLAKWIISHFPAHRVYTEAFGGAASVLLQKSRAYVEVYNDIYGEVVNLFRVLRDEKQAAALARLVELTPYARDEFTASYEVADDGLERARRLVARSFMGFGTKLANSHEANGFRGGAKCLRQSVADEWSRFPENLLRVSERFRRVVVEHKPALELLAQYDTTEALHYVDPPYPKHVRGDDGDDYAEEMTDAAHLELGKLLHALKGMVIVSGYACDLYDLELFADWHRVEREALADGARPRTEVLWINEAAWQARQSVQQSFL
jgi:DNA adenine methylase